MEPQQTKINLTILFVSCRSIMHQVLRMLDYDALSSLYNCYTGKSIMGQISIKHCNVVRNDEQKIILNILASYYYIRRYMLQTDRSFYYSIYESNQFLEIQNQQLAKLTETQNGLSEMLLRRENLMDFVRQILVNAEAQQILETIQRFADDPDIPMAKLQRQNVGPGCTSVFQQFLISLYCDEGSNNLNPEYDSLNQFFQQRIDEAYLRQFLKISKSSKRQAEQMKIRVLRFAPYEINYENFKQYLLPENQLHNFIIGLLLIAQQQIIASKKYIETLDDPHHRFLQIMLRYSLFRNFVISMQEEFNFVFEAYTELYGDTFGDCKNFPLMTFWRPAFTKWFLQMSKFQQQCDQLFVSQLTSLRQRNTIQFLHSCEINYPELYRKITNTYELTSCAVNRKSQMIQLLADQMDVLYKQYSDYIVDLSLDEISVFQCGHSLQKLTLPFQQFEKQVLHENKQFLNHTLSNIKQKNICQKIFANDLKFIYENSLVKPSTSSKIAEAIKEQLDLIDDKQIQESIYEFDSKLDYFNEKNAEIPRIKDPYLRSFYQIVPEVSIKEILSKSFDTTASEISQIDSSLVYDSEEDQEDQSNIIKMDIEIEQNQNKIYEPPSSLNQSSQFYQFSFDYSKQSSQMIQENEQLREIYGKLAENANL